MISNKNRFRLDISDKNSVLKMRLHLVAVLRPFVLKLRLLCVTRMIEIFLGAFHEMSPY